jgi:hypothetical protein
LPSLEYYVPLEDRHYYRDFFFGELVRPFSLLPRHKSTSNEHEAYQPAKFRAFIERRVPKREIQRKGGAYLELSFTIRTLDLVRRCHFTKILFEDLQANYGESKLTALQKRFDGNNLPDML